MEKMKMISALANAELQKIEAAFVLEQKMSYLNRAKRLVAMHYNAEVQWSLLRSRGESPEMASTFLEIATEAYHEAKAEVARLELEVAVLVTKLEVAELNHSDLVGKALDMGF
jgi:hypothetical protein